MSGLCGWVCFDDFHQPSENQIHDMATHLNRDSASLTLNESSPYCSLSTVALNNRGYVYKDEYGMIAIFGFLRIDAAKIKHLVHNKGIANALFDLYHRKGEQILQYLAGPFSLAVVLKNEKKALLAIDHMGIGHLNYRFADNKLVFAENSAALVATTKISPTLDQQSLFNYMYFHTVPSPHSIYKGYHRILPGCFIELTGNKITHGRYWQAQFEREKEKLTLSLLRDEFYTALRSSVQKETQTKPLGVLLSGDIDSSTITGILGEINNEPVRTYAIGFEEAKFDKMEYARVVAKHFRTKHNEYYISAKDIIEVIPKIARAFAEPFGNLSAAPIYYCAAMARSDGIKKLLCGEGGNELFAGKQRYATQIRLSKYHEIPEVLRVKLIQPLASGMPQVERIPFFKKLRNYIKQAKVAMPARMEAYNYLERIGLETMFEKEYLTQVDIHQPIKMLTQLYESALCDTLINRMLAIDYKISLADNELPKMNTMCDLAGIEVGYPMLHDRIVQFADSLPIYFKVKKNKLRYFFKEALQGYLPAIVLNHEKRSGEFPVGRWLQKHKGLYEMAADSLTGLKTRHLLKADYLDTLLNKSLKQNPEYYGRMIWVLMMLEHWFIQHVDSNKQPSDRIRIN